MFSSLSVLGDMWHDLSKLQENMDRLFVDRSRFLVKYFQ